MGPGSTHPGYILQEELEARGLTAPALAHKLRIPPGEFEEIVSERRAITPEAALRLGRYFGNEAEFWMNLQTQYDLAELRRTRGERIAAEVEQAA